MPAALPADAVFARGEDVLTSSLIVADVFGKRHDNVLRDVALLATSSDLRTSGWFRPVTYRDAKGEDRPAYDLTRDGLSLLVMGFTGPKAANFKIAFITAFNRMEAQLRARAPADPLAALRDPAALRTLLLEQTERVLALQADVATLAPKAEALDRLTAVPDGSMCVTDAAKVLGMRPKDLFAYLSGAGWTYRRAGNSGWLAYQARIAAGLAEHRATSVERPDGTEKVVSRLLITPKGLAKLAQDLGGGQHKAPIAA